MTPAAEVKAPNSCTLYDLEDTLQAWVTTFESTDEESSRTEILSRIGEAIQKARDKRDRVVAFLQHCQNQEKFADLEIERIEQRKAFIARVRRELEAYIIRVMDEFAKPDRRGIRWLEGNLSTLRLQKNPDSVVIYDDRALPAAWKDAVITMPAYVWEALLGRLTMDERVTFEKELKKIEFRPDKRALAPELKRGIEVPGADLSFGDLRLVVD